METAPPPSYSMRSHISVETPADMRETEQDIRSFDKSTSMGSNALDTRMHVMRERFKNLALLDYIESHSEDTSPLAGNGLLTQHHLHYKDCSK